MTEESVGGCITWSNDRGVIEVTTEESVGGYLTNNDGGVGWCMSDME